ncbi:diguanylate cyclase [Acinetobacter tandoii]|uniref:bifunctional diguanylate cyclase/phosphodiesterase n=1 Tax=Acinetobacter tandoii TaxID=202954 RepID=UPI000C1FF8DD|nr:EAL domain-containing protein [Acinetobacter tandoii]PJG44825.1 diguanylate cyclase [Acinetobacter tandoii]
MVHIHYDLSLVVGSILFALLACLMVVSLEQLLFRGSQQKLHKVILVTSGLVLGVAIWCMHFIAIFACQFPESFSIDLGLTLTSYVIAFVASTFAIWLITRPTLSFARLIMGAVLMGLGISGMHYTGMLALKLPSYHIQYDAMMVVFSIIFAICGSGLTFWLTFKYKAAIKYKFWLKLCIAFMMAISIVGMHFSGMAATKFVQDSTDLLNLGQSGYGLIVFTVLLVTSLIFIAAFFVAVLEQRLEERNIQLYTANQELAKQAVRDNLTKLPNRLYLAEYAYFLFTNHRYNDQKIAFLFIDLDRFKGVNDVFGHHVGDQLLVQLSSRIHAQLNERQKLLRIGGDEFLMVIEDASLEQAERMAAVALEQIQESFLIAGKEINISASVGIAMFPEHGNNLQDLLINADAAMLSSKYQGRNTYSVFNYTADQQETKSLTKLINDLYKAVEEQQFVLFYQPKFTTQDHQICGVEALIRWQHPTLGLLTPNMFIRGAEKTGLIIELGYWVLEQACRQIQIWEKNNVPFFPVAVNLSAVQFEHKHLFTNLEQLFEKYQIDPSHLMIEITETTAMHHIESSILSFERLRQMGIKLAIDDFGTGHSSFLYLKNLPVDELKIDREFIYDLEENSKEEMILESIIQLAIKLGLVVTAEGVECASQAEILSRLGCQQLQGYLFAMPMEVEQLERI